MNDKTIEDLINHGRYNTALDLINGDLKEQEISSYRDEDYYFELLSDKIEVLYYKGSIDEAIAVCEKVLEEKTSNFYAILYKARILKDKEKYEEAGLWYNKLVEAENGIGWIWSEKGKVDYINRNFYEAYKSYIKALDLFLSENDAFNINNLWCIEESFKEYTYLYTNCLIAAEKYISMLLSNDKKEEAKLFYKEAYKYDIMDTEHSNLIHDIYWKLDEDLEDIEGFAEMKGLYSKTKRQFESATEHL